MFCENEITLYMNNTLHSYTFVFILAQSWCSISREIGGDSVIVFSVLCVFSVCSPYITNFLILLQHNIRPLSCNCNPCATEFVVGVNLRRHDTLIPTVMNVMTIFP